MIFAHIKLVLKEIMLYENRGKFQKPWKIDGTLISWNEVVKNLTSSK